MIKKYLFIPIFILFSLSAAYPQTGPGGVGTSTNNKLWLKADDLNALGTGNPVTTWTDASGNLNHAGQTGTNRPTFITGVVNARPVVRFDGVDDFFANVFTVGAQNNSIFTVFAHDHNGTSQPAGPIWVTDNTSANTGLFPKWSDGNQYLQTGGGTWLSQASTYTINTWYETSVIYNTASTRWLNNGSSNQSAAANSISLGGFDIGLRTNSGPHYFKGDIAELIYYNTPVNEAQRIIIENYLASKYGLTITNDKFSYDALHGNEVAGIGRFDAGNTHLTAQSGGVLEASNASALGDGDYLLFGHDGASMASWTNSEVPSADVNLKRIAREWRFNKTGTVGTVTIDIDTTLLPVKSANYDFYLLWIDADGDFTNGAISYPVIKSGGRYVANGITIADGNYFTISTFRAVTQLTTVLSSGAESTSPTLTVSLNYAASRDVKMTYTDLGTGTADGAGDDYTLTGSLLTIVAGTTSATFGPVIVDDPFLEGDETIRMAISSPSYGILGTNTNYIYTINDNDNGRKIDFSAASSNPSETPASVNLIIQINVADAINPTTVKYTVTGGTATGGGVDYTLANGTAVIPATTTSVLLPITIIDDLLNETNETIIITLTSPTNSNLGTNKIYTLTIDDDDPVPTIQFVTSSSNGIEGSTPASINVSLSAPSGRTVTVDYADAFSGTATSGSDYNLTSGTLTIPAGSTSASFNITIIDDGLIEAPETINITLSNPTGATLGGITSNTFTLNDNDVSLGFTGPGGVGNSTYNKLWLKATDLTAVGNGNPVTTWTDASGSGNNATQAGASRPIFFTGAVNSQPAVRFDGVDDFFSNVFTVTAQNNSIFTVFAHDHNGTTQPAGPLWVTDNTSANTGLFPRWSDGNQYLQTGGGTWLSQTSSYTRNTWYETSAIYNTASTEWLNNGAANQSSAANSITVGAFDIGLRSNSGPHYYKGDIAELIYFNTPVNSAQRIIIENYLASKYGLTIANDKFSFDASHGNEVAGIGRVDASNIHVAAQSAGILKTSNASGLVDGDFLLFGHDNGSITTWTTSEAPNAGVNTFRISREWKFNKTGTVGTVSLTVDPTLLPALPGGYSQYVVWVDADGDFSSGATTYQATLSGGSYLANGVTIPNGYFVTIGLIRPSIQFTATTNSGLESAIASIQVSQDYVTTTNTTVNYSVTGGTATAGTDFILAAGTATILAGQTTTNIVPSIINDILVESDETIIITLTSPSPGVVLGANTVNTYTIQDDDNARKIDFTAASTSAAEGVLSVVLTVQINNVDASNPTTVVYTVTGGTATGSGLDYTLANGTATVNPNTLTTTIPFSVIDDLLNEANETIIITLSSPTNSNLGTNKVYTYTINDNDPAPTIQFLSATSSGIEGVSPSAITVSLSAPSGQNVSIDYVDAGTGTATGGGTDYTFFGGTLTIPAGSTSASFNVNIVDDAIIEAPETIIFTISNPTGGATLGGIASNTFTLNDNDVSLGFTGPGGVGNSTNNKLWLKATDLTALGNGNPVTTWTDASGSGNNATQAGTSRPTFITGAVNAQPAVRFDGVDDYFSNVFTVTAQNNSIFTVFAHDHNGTTQPAGPLWVTDNTSPNTGLFPRWSDGNQYLQTGGGTWLSQTSTYTRNTWYETSVIYNTASTIWLNNGAANQSSAANSISLGAFDIGLRANSGPHYFKGDISELIYFNTPVNSAQRIIIENYLASKYGLTITNDKFAYDATHGNEVAGIGRVDASNIHVAAQSAGILKTSNASGLVDGDFLLFGHDNGSIAAWTTSEAPNAGVNTYRVAREWRFNKTGTVGTVTLTIDPTLLPALPGGYSQYVIWVDADGDFSSGATAYQATLSGSTYYVSGVTISNGFFVSFGTVLPQIQFTSITSSGFENTLASIPVSIDYVRATDVSVNYTVTGGTATASSDYILAAGTVTILAGQTSANIVPSIINDIIVESDETIIVTLSSPSAGVALGPNTVNTFTIHDDDNSRKIDFNAASSNAAESVGSVILTIQTNAVDVTNPTTVVYTVTGGTATGGGVDYVLANGTATVAANASTTTFSFSVNNDLLHETDETIIISLSSPTNANLGTNSVYTYTINDDDAAPTVQFLTATSNGVEGVSPASITVSLSSPSGQNVTVDYTDALTGTATNNGIDYTFVNSTLTIPAGSTIGNFTIAIVDDAIIEVPETMVITLSNPTGATLGGFTTNTFTLNDNDVSLGFTGPGGVGNSTNNKLWLKASDLTAVGNGNPVTTWTDASGSGNNATQAGASRPIFFTGAVNSQPAVRFDGVDDFFSNVFTVTAQNNSIFTVFAHDHNGTTQPAGPLWVTDNTSANTGLFPRWSDGNQYLQTGGGTWLSQTSSYTRNTWYETSAIYNTASTEWLNNGAANQSSAANSITVGAFDIGLRSNSGPHYYKGDIAELIYYNTPVNTAQRIIIENYLASKYGLTTANDKFAYDMSHGNEVAGIGRADASNIHLAAQSAGILKVSNPAAMVDGNYLLFGHDNGSIAAWTTTESPNAGVNTVRIAREWRVNKTGVVGAVSVSVDPTLLPVAPGGYDQTIVWVDTDGDFSSGATAYAAALIGGVYVANTVTIPNGSFVSFGIIRSSIQFTTASSNGPENALTNIQVSLDYAKSINISVNYNVTGGTATSGVDYILANGTVTIPAGQTTANIVPSIINDILIESDETIIITLSSPTGGVALGTNSVHTFTINDDDNTRKIDFSAASSSGSELTASVILTININQVDAVNPTTVNYAATSGTATGGGVDYTLASGVATIPANAASTTISLTIVDDAINESDETVIISLSSPTNSNLGTNQTYTYTINDNDAAPTIQFASATSSGIEGTTPGVMTVNLSAAAGQDITVDYTVTGGTATAGIDYILADGTLTIVAGSTTGDINAVIIDDSLTELAETIQVTLSNPTVASLGGTTVTTYFIIDNDPTLGFSGPGGVGNSTYNKLWIKADDLTAVGNGNPISTWTDASGNANNPTQAGSSRPVLVTGVLNTRPIVRFDGVDDFYANVFNVLSTNNTIFTVFAHDHDGVSQPSGPLWVTDDSSPNTGFFPRWSDGNQYLQTGGGTWLSQTSTYTRNVWYESTVTYDVSSTVWLTDGVVNQSAGANSISIGSFDIGVRSNSGPHYYRGDIAEIIYYNTPLNIAQRIIVENYLSTKYGLGIIADKYGFDATHSYELAGIGFQNSTNFHSAAQSAGMLEISSPSSLDVAGDYLLFAHDNASVASWTATESPGTGIKRLAREWRFDESGTVGSVTITLDFTSLPVLEAGYDGFAVLIDADGDFSSGATISYATSLGGNLYSVSGVTITDGYYVALAEVQNVSVATGSFSTPGTWLTGVVPGSGQSATIRSPHVVTLTANQTIGGLTVNSGGTLVLGANTLTIDGVSSTLTINAGATFNPGTGTVTYGALGIQCVSPLTYYSLRIGGIGTKTLCGNTIVNGNLSIGILTTLDVDNTNNYSITLAGNFTNLGTFTGRNGTVFFNGGSGSQTITAPLALTFYNLTENKASGNVLINNYVTVNNALTLTSGKFVIGAQNLILGSAATVSGSSSNYIQADGTGVIQKMFSTTGSVSLPMGDVSLYSPMTLTLNSATLTSASISFKVTNAIHPSIPNVGIRRYWTVTPSGVASPNYNIVYTYDQSDVLPGGNETIYRPVKYNGAVTSGVATDLNETTNTITWNGLTSFSDFSADSPSALPIELLYFRGKIEGVVASLDWSTESELINDYFEVQRSASGESFNSIVKIKGAGTTTLQTRYAYQDAHPFQGKNYYRLKQVDYDGKFTYSKVIVLEVLHEQDIFSLVVYPNPTQVDEVNLQLQSSDQINPVQIKVLDLMGKTIFANVVTMDDTARRVTLMLPSLTASGVYIVIVEQGGRKQMTRLVIR